MLPSAAAAAMASAFGGCDLESSDAASRST